MDFKRKLTEKVEKSISIDQYRKDTIEQYNVEPGETTIHRIYEVMSKSDDIKEFYMAQGVKYACDFIREMIGRMTDIDELDDTEIVDELYTATIGERTEDEF